MAKNNLGNNSKLKAFVKHEVFNGKSRIKRLKTKKTTTKNHLKQKTGFSKKWKNTLFWAKMNFQQKPLKKPKKTNEPILRKTLH